jgi:hypothetical protein
LIAGFNFFFWNLIFQINLWAFLQWYQERIFRSLNSHRIIFSMVV